MADKQPKKLPKWILTIFGLIKIIYRIIFWPIYLLATPLSRLFIRCFRSLCASVAKHSSSMVKPRIAKFLFSICLLVIEFIVIVLAFYSYIEGWAIIPHSVFNSWANSDIPILPIFAPFFDFYINDWVLDGFLTGFAVVNFIALFMLLIFDKKIKRTREEDDIKRQEAENNGFEFIPKHRVIDFIAWWIDYNHQEKVQHKIDFVSIKSKIDTTFSNGAIVSRKNKIMFYKEYWKYHALFFGAAKTGVTNDMINWALSGSYFHYPIIYMDSENSSSTIEKMKSIATKFQSTFILLNFTSSKVKYAPFLGKNHNQIAEMLTYSLLKKEEVNNYGEYSPAKIIQEILNFMEINRIEPTINSVANNFNQKYLSETYFQAPAKKYETTDLGNLLRDEQNLQILNHVNLLIAKFFKAFEKYLTNDEKESNMLNFTKSLMPKLAGPVIYIEVPEKISEDHKRIIKRMLFKDVLINSSIGESDRQVRNISVVFLFHGLTDFFYNPNEVSHSFATLSMRNFCLGIDIRGFTFSNNDISLINETILSAKTYFIHKNTDKNISALLEGALTSTRSVNLTFQTDEIKWKNKKDKSRESLKATLLNAAATKGNILASLGMLQLGEIYFKTLHTTNNKRFQKNSRIEDIIYEVPIEATEFSQNLAAVK